MLIIEYKNKKYKLNEIKILVFSENPYYIGIGLKPSDPAWIAMKEAKEFILKENKNKKKFVVDQELEIGDNTWFISKLTRKKERQKTRRSKSK